MYAIFVAPALAVLFLILWLVAEFKWGRKLRIAFGLCLAASTSAAAGILVLASQGIECGINSKFTHLHGGYLRGLEIALDAQQYSVARDSLKAYRQAFDAAPFSNEAPRIGLNVIYKGIPADRLEASERKLFSSEPQR